MKLPPVPSNSGLFSPIEGTSHEQKTAVKIINTFAHVYRLKMTMRFEDKILISILFKMRQKGGCTLSESEWKAMEDTEIPGPNCPKLKGAEAFT